MSEQTATTPFDMLGGREPVAKLVNRFYDLVEQDPAYADLRAMHAGSLDKVRESLTSFLVGWLGGPRDWFSKGGCVMTMHSPLAIDTHVTQQWIDAMNRAVADCGFENSELATKMGEALGDMARGMINR